jgi:Arc/MetJ family transcription regulator
VVYGGVMSRTNIDIDDELVGWVMHRYRLKTKREAVDYALRRLRREPMSREEVRSLRGTGWHGDLDEMRAGTGSKWDRASR